MKRAALYGLMGTCVLTIAVGVQASTVTYQRSADLAAATNVNDGDNSHGGVTDPSGGLWSYAYLTETDRAADGEAPADFQALNASSATTYSKQEIISGRLDGQLSATATTLRNYWNNNGDNPTLRNADLMAVFSAPDAGTYSISGVLAWEQSNTTLGSGAEVFVGKIVGGTFTFLLQQAVSTSTLNTFSNIALTDPGLSGLALNSGDQLVFGIRGMGAPHQYRMMTLDDSGATITQTTLAVPEPMAGALLSLGMLAGAGRRRRRR